MCMTCNAHQCQVVKLTLHVRDLSCLPAMSGDELTWAVEVCVSGGRGCSTRLLAAAFMHAGAAALRPGVAAGLRCWPGGKR